MKILLMVLAGICVILTILELGLRSRFGFGNPLTYIADSQIGYLLAPDQQTRRFGSRIAINRYSMRSPDISPTRPPNSLRILLIGDSIANGGWWTDQDQTISALLQQQLSAAPHLITNLRSDPQQTFEQVQVLNASANSWAPRNELAYLQRFGSFEAQVIVLLINTDDLFGTAPTSVVVGRDRNYPDHKPALALTEVISRYLLKPSPIPELEAVQAEGGDRVGANLEAIRQIKGIANQANARLLLALTPLLREIGTSGSRDYEQKARQRLQDFTQQAQIPFIDFLPLLNAHPNPASLYHDHIHFNVEGNSYITQQIVQQMQQMEAIVKKE